MCGHTPINTRDQTFSSLSNTVFFSLSQEAKETLLDPEKRKNYDKWKNSGISISYKAWTSMKDHVHQVRRGDKYWVTTRITTQERVLRNAT
jgi:DnaJ-class molecular chaperone with C-terminal Zn finger domain